MGNKQKYELTKLRNSRFPSFFFITMENENGTRSELISTTQTSSANTFLTGEKPDTVSEFKHARGCLITVANFQPQLSIAERSEIAKNTSDLVEVGVLIVESVGAFKLFIDNKNSKIYLKGLD